MNPTLPSKIPTKTPTLSPTSCDELCDAFDIRIRTITPDPFDDTATVYEYEIDRLSNQGICSGDIVSLVLGICNNDDVNLIFGNIITWSPLIVDGVNVDLMKLNTTINSFGIIGIEANLPVSEYRRFTLIIRHINNTMLSNITAFEKNGDSVSCFGDGLPCL